MSYLTMKPRLEGWKQILLMFSLALFMVFSISTICVKVSASDLPVHNIDTGLDYATIQEAIDSPETSDGHTILVDGGIYHEQVTVNKTVKLLSASQTTTIIDGNGAEQVVSLTASGAEVAGFTVQNGSKGIDLEYVENVSVTDNKVLNCSYAGIFIHECSKCRIVNDTVVSANQAGIYLWESVGIVITNNTVSNTSHGIWLLVHSTKNIINNNLIMNNPQGIVSSYNCNNNTIVGNTVTSSSVGGIVMGGAHNNTIYHNNVLQNAKQAWSYGDSSNFWDDGSEGNFWEDYLEPDLNEDGIGDTPYTIDENNRDNHPLMGTFYDFNVVWEEENYHVNIISNSTVSDFDFRVTYEPEVRKAISFNVTGEDDSVGFCRVTIPTTLVNYSYTVLVNGEKVDATVLDTSNSTHAYLYFTYNTSTKHVLIVPEFASALTLPLLMVFTFLAVVFSKKKINTRSSIAISQPIYTRLKTNLLHTCEVKELGKGS